MEKLSPIQQYPRVNMDFNPQIPPLKKIKDKTKINVRYALIAPFAFVHIYWDPKSYEMIYQIEEPILSEQEQLYRDQIIYAMRDLINFETLIGEGQDALLEYIDKRFKLLSIELGLNLSYESYKKLEDAFVNGDIHPMDLKQSTAFYINELIKPVREHFENDPKAKKLKEQVESFKVTR